MKELLWDEDAEQAAQEVANGLKAKMAETEARLAQEREWATRYPGEWAEWRRISLLLDQPPIDFADPSRSFYDFPDFLDEVGPRPSPRHSIERLDETRPFIRGNLHWQEQRSIQLPPDLVTYSVSDVAGLLGLSTDTVYDMVQRTKELPAVKVRGQWRVSQSALREYLDRCRPGVTKKKVPPKPARRPLRPGKDWFS
jgi:excisionase family DNA binding protein